MKMLKSYPEGNVLAVVTFFQLETRDFDIMNLCVVWMIKFETKMSMVEAYLINLIVFLDFVKAQSLIQSIESLSRKYALYI